MTALRRWMLGIAAFMSVGTMIELGVEGHYESIVQGVPFVVSALGLGLASLSFANPEGHVRGRRIVAILVVLAAGLGMWEHLEHNAEFEQEIRPTADLATVWAAAFFGGNPVLAPGLMAAMGLLLAGSTAGQGRAT